MAFAQGNGSAMSLVIAVLCLLAAVECAHGKQFLVGGDAGWTLPSFGHVNYTEWTAINKYHLGDSLLFNYSKDFHNVLVVNKVDYLACSSVNPIATFQDGHTIINLNKTGAHYYICGVPGHCSQGQKLLVFVAKARGGGHSGPSPAPVPSQSATTVQNPGNGPSAAGPESSAPGLKLTWAVVVLGAILAGLPL